jgi:hypothetical protein
VRGPNHPLIVKLLVEAFGCALDTSELKTSHAKFSKDSAIEGPYRAAVDFASAHPTRVDIPGTLLGQADQRIREMFQR